MAHYRTAEGVPPHDFFAKPLSLAESGRQWLHRRTTGSAMRNPRIFRQIEGEHHTLTTSGTPPLNVRACLALEIRRPD